MRDFCFDFVLQTQMQTHWENIYTTKDLKKVSWHESEPVFSLGVITQEIEHDSVLQHRPKDGLRIIDVGSGDSLLACKLIASGYRHVTAADISSAAIEAAKARCTLDGVAGSIDWKVADITNADFETSAFDVWHDRAVFHFMTTAEQQNAYVDTCARSLADHGIAIIGTFSRNGPKQCSGIDIVQHDEESLRSLFAEKRGFKFVKSFNYVHTTPGGSKQDFIFAIFSRLPGNH